LADCPEVHDQAHIVVAHAVPFAGGWELHIPDVGVTQVADLADAAEQVRSLLATTSYPSVEKARIKVFRPAGSDDDFRVCTSNRF
jgi:hypothetical protein